MSLILRNKKFLGIAVCFMFAWVAGTWFILDMQIVQAATLDNPVSWPNFWQSFVMWSIAGVLVISGLLCIIVSFLKSKPKHKKIILE